MLPLAGLGGGLFTPALSNWLMRAAPPAFRGRLAGAMRLPQHDLLLGPARGPPPPHPTLQRPQLPVLIPRRVLLLQ